MQRRDHFLDRFIKIDVRFNLRDQRHVGVVVVQLAQTENASPQIEISKERLQVRAHRGDQSIVNFYRDVVGKQRGFECG